MESYIPLLEAALKQRGIPYTLHNGIIVFIRRFFNDTVDVRMKFTLVLFRAEVEVVASVMQPLEPEQMAKARLLAAKSDKTIYRGEIDCDHPSGCLRYVGSFDPLVGPEWPEEARQQMQEFIVEYTTGIVPEIVLDIFVRAVDPSYLVPEDDETHDGAAAAVESPAGDKPDGRDTSESRADDEYSFARLWQRITGMEAANQSPTT
jgi:hypothetical protein